MCRVLQRGNSGDGCDFASTLCKYDLRKGVTFVLSWARVRRVSRGSDLVYARPGAGQYPPEDQDR